MNKVQDVTAQASTGTALSVGNLATGATAGNILILVVNSDGTFTGPPSGFLPVPGTPVVNFSSLAVYYKVASGGETSASIAWTGASTCEGWLSEWAALSANVDVAATSTVGSTSVSTVTTGNAVTTYANDLLIVAAGQGRNIGFVSSSWTNSFVDQANLTNVGPSCMYVGSRIVTATGTYNSTATNAVATGNEVTVIVAFKDSSAPTNVSVTPSSAQGLGQVAAPTISTGAPVTVQAVSAHGLGQEPQPAFGSPINLVQHQENPSGASPSQTVTINPPVVGNLLVAWANCDNTVNTPTGITGWTLAVSVVADNAVYMWYKVVQPGDSTQVTFVASASGPIDCGVMEWSGCSAARPYDGQNVSSAASPGTVTAACSVNATGMNGDLVLALAGLHRPAAVPTNNSWNNGYNQVINSGTGGTSLRDCYTFIGYQILPAPAVTSTNAAWTGAVVDRQELLVAFIAPAPISATVPAPSASGMGQVRVPVVYAGPTFGVTVNAASSHGVGQSISSLTTQVDVVVTSMAGRGMGSSPQATAVATMHPLSPTAIVGGLRSRLIFDSTYRVIGVGLEALGWFDPGRRHQPINLIDSAPDTDIEVPLNTLAVSDENVSSAEWEMGSNLAEKTRFYYVDLFAENDSLGKHLIGDVADILEGRFPSIGRAGPEVLAYDLRQATPTVFTTCVVEGLQVDRAHGWTKPWLRHWYSIQFRLVDFYQDDSEVEEQIDPATFGWGLFGGQYPWDKFGE